MSDSGHRSARPPRVLHVTEAFGGGVAAAINSYAQVLPEVEHHIAVRERADAPLMEKRWRKNFTSITFLPESNLAAALTVRKLIAQLTPDVVHSHSSFGGFFARWNVSGGKRIKHVYTPHGWAFLRRDKNIPERFAYWLAEAALGVNTDTLAACSEDEGRVAPLLANKVTVIPNTLSQPADRAAVGWETPVPSDPSRPLIAGAGRLRAETRQQKDPEYFIEAVRLLRQGGHGFRALWVGGGDAVMEERMRESGIAVTGWRPSAVATQILGTADIYLHSALWDGFPLTVLDAHAHGVPTLIRDVPAFRSVDWPFKLRGPGDLAELWPEITSMRGRDLLISAADSALRRNTSEQQRATLLQAYSLDGIDEAALHAA